MIEAVKQRFNLISKKNESAYLIFWALSLFLTIPHFLKAMEAPPVDPIPPKDPKVIEFVRARIAEQNFQDHIASTVIKQGVKDAPTMLTTPNHPFAALQKMLDDNELTFKDLPTKDIPTLDCILFWLNELSDCTTLDLRFHLLRSVPDEIGRLTKIKVLNLSNNTLVELTPAIEKLTNLEVLYLSNNYFVQLPEDSILKLKKLVLLDLSHNVHLLLNDDFTRKLLDQGVHIKF